ncbi:MAG: hypothetical protein NTZ50_12415 [Chloroflexi bacterium]|nr:hypothetical protein [Chloroflexota bacterium]
MTHAVEFTAAAIVALLLWLIPGLAVLAWLWPSDARPLTPGQRLAAAVGIGICLPPLLLYITDLIGLRWSGAATIGYAVVGIAALAAALFRTKPARPNAAALLRSDLPAIAAISALAIVMHLYMVRDLNAGMFGDSVHHTLIARLLVERGGLFDSWQPYAPLTTLTYHFGFHANVAFFSWISGIGVNRSLVLVGQLLNALTAPLMYLLASRLFMGAHGERSAAARRIGLWAAAFAGFANLMPAWFVNWGRYTQLTGHQVLIVLLVAWFELIEAAISGTARRAMLLRMAAISALLLAALMLTHYIVLMFAAVAVAVYLLLATARVGTNRRALLALVLSAGAAAAALLVATPWILNTLNSGLVRNTSMMATGASGVQRQEAAAALGAIAPLFIRGWLLALAALGVLLATLRRRWEAAFLMGWALLILLLVTPRTLGLPGTGVVEQFTAYLSLYLALTPLAAYALVEILDALAGIAKRWTQRTADVVTAFGVAALCVYGTSWLPSVLDLRQQMLTPADERAMVWIRENTATDARFVVNTFPGYGGSVIAGTDAGWWLTQMTGRWTNLPPMTYGSEKWEQPNYKNTNAFAAALRGRKLTDSTPLTVDLTTAENLQRLRNAAISYVYLGAGAAPGPDVADHIDDAVLRRNPSFELVYASEGVRIFRLR